MQQQRSEKGASKLRPEVEGGALEKGVAAVFNRDQPGTEKKKKATRKATIIIPSRARAAFAALVAQMRACRT